MADKFFIHVPADIVLYIKMKEREWMTACIFGI